MPSLWIGSAGPLPYGWTTWTGWTRKTWPWPCAKALRRSLDPAAVDWKVRAATRALVNARGRCSADDVVRLTGIPGRTLRGALSDGIGMGPKRVARLLRLHRSIGLGLAPHGGWARVAAEAGYTDQAHLIRDFKDLVGETPARFVARGESA